MMRLSLITEANATELKNILINAGINASNYSDHAISFKADPGQIDRIKALVKHHGWQIHSISKPIKNFIHGDITPLKNQPYTVKCDILYHITDSSNVQSILAHGLKLSGSTPGMIYPHRVYLYPTKDVAIKRLQMAKARNWFANKTCEPILLRIDNTANKYKLFIDPEYYMGMGGDADDVTNVPVYTTKPVSPNDISIDRND